jgi:hypothetical protein
MEDRKMTVIESFDAQLRRFVGLGLRPLAAGIVGAGLAGAAIGFAFPQFEASALLQFPGPARAREAVTEPLAGERGRLDVSNAKPAIDLATFRRVSASYRADSTIKAYVDARQAGSAAAARLLALARQADFFDRALTPVLPYNRRDLKEFGELKTPPAPTLVGVDITLKARDEALARQTLELLGDYLVSAVMREQLRSWVLAGRAETVGQLKATQAEIVNAGMQIQQLEQRVADTKQIITRYPEAARMDVRQVVNVAEGGERFLSPLAQLVSFESGISQERIRLARLQRTLAQKDLLAKFFDRAEAEIDANAEIGSATTALRRLAEGVFSAADSSQDWVQQSSLLVSAELDAAQVAIGQFGLRDAVTVSAVTIRRPLPLAALLSALTLAAIAGLALVRAALASARADAA